MTNILVTILFGGPALFGFYIGAKLVLQTRRDLSGAIRTPAVVVGLDAEAGESATDNRPMTYFHPIVEFADESGIKRRVRTPQGSSPPAFKEGAAVTVFYRPGDPEHAQIDAWAELWAIPAILMGICGVALLIVAAYWILGGAR